MERSRHTRLVVIVASVVGVLIVGVGAAFAVPAVLDPEPAASVSASPSASASPSESAPTPSPDEVTSPDPVPSASASPEPTEEPQTSVVNPSTLSWSAGYSPAWGVPVPFMPDGDYPGEVTAAEGVADGAAYDVAPAYFEDIDPIVLGVDVQEVGRGGTTVEVHAIEGGEMLTPKGGWIVVSVLTDYYSAEPRWAVCRFHVPESQMDKSEMKANSVFCSQAQNPWAPESPWVFIWAMDGQVLKEMRGVPDSDDAASYDIRPKGEYAVGSEIQGVAIEEFTGAGESSPDNPFPLDGYAVINEQARWLVPTS